ncbi:MAG: tyrosine-type recombinase/integrase [Oscillospiraceae bacterium]|nr:tyrosine-type recombinase/integrase [Oscillospiraceae bacterium]
MSSISKINRDGKTLYKVCFDLPRYNNKRRKSSRTFPPKTPYAEVKAFALQKDREYQTGKKLLVENSNITFKELAEIYLKEFLIGLSPTTIASYESILKNSKPYGVFNVIGNLPINKVNLTCLQGYILRLSEEGISAKTIKNTYMVISSVFKLAIKMGIITKDRNPMDDVVLPKLTKPNADAYTEEEVKLILQRAKEDNNDKIYLLLLVALFLGLRRGEIIGLKFSKIDFKTGKITIDENRVVVKGKAYVKPPKTNSGIREVIAPKLLMDELRKVYNDYLTHKLKYGKGFIDSEAIFTHNNGTPYTPQGIGNLYQRFLKRNPDIPPKNFHMLRHTFCSQLLRANLDIKTVSALMGHSHIDITLTRYAHSYEEGKKEAAEKLDNIFNNSFESA